MACHVQGKHKGLNLKAANHTGGPNESYPSELAIFAINATQVLPKMLANNGRDRLVSQLHKDHIAIDPI